MDSADNFGNYNKVCVAKFLIDIQMKLLTFSIFVILVIKRNCRQRKRKKYFLVCLSYQIYY